MLGDEAQFQSVIEHIDKVVETRTEERRRCYAAALRFRQQGLNFLPKKAQERRAAVKWKNLQVLSMTDEEMVEHVHLYAGDLGFITGPISNRIVLDTDDIESKVVLAAVEESHGPVPEACKVDNGSGRDLCHHFFHPGHKVMTVANTEIKLDINGYGGLSTLYESEKRNDWGHVQEHPSKLSTSSTGTV